jgi:hypothetical protein
VAEASPEADATTLMFEPGTGEVLDIPVPFQLIHDGEFVDYAEAALAQQFFARYLAAGGDAPSEDQCVGYKTPLFISDQPQTGVGRQRPWEENRPKVPRLGPVVACLGSCRLSECSRSW